MEQDELRWRQYQVHVDLYKFYLELVLKLKAGYYVVTGSIVAYYLTHRSEGLARVASVLPLILTVGVGVVSYESPPTA